MLFFLYNCYVSNLFWHLVSQNLVDISISLHGEIHVSISFWLEKHVFPVFPTSSSSGDAIATEGAILSCLQTRKERSWNLFYSRILKCEISIFLWKLRFATLSFHYWPLGLLHSWRGWNKNFCFGDGKIVCGMVCGHVNVTWYTPSQL